MDDSTGSRDGMEEVFKIDEEKIRGHVDQVVRQIWHNQMPARQAKHPRHGVHVINVRGVPGVDHVVDRLRADPRLLCDGRVGPLPHLFQMAQIAGQGLAGWNLVHARYCPTAAR